MEFEISAPAIVCPSTDILINSPFIGEPSSGRKPATTVFIFEIRLFQVTVTMEDLSLSDEKAGFLVVYANPPEVP